MTPGQAAFEAWWIVADPSHKPIAFELQGKQIQDAWEVSAKAAYDCQRKADLQRAAENARKSEDAWQQLKEKIYDYDEGPDH